MHTATIRKGKKTRTVYIAGKRERLLLDGLANELAAIERKLAHQAGTSSVSHGFVTARNPVTCALAHVGFAVTVSMDLAGWFDSVREDQIPVERRILNRIIVQGAPRQGLPTSPAACNIAAIPMDRRIIERLARLPCRAAYTRYADDLTVSVADTSRVDEAQAIVREEVERMGWRVAEHKTRIQYADAGRRVIVGISVGERDLRATRRTKRRLRAAKHQKRDRQITGLGEWASCKLPNAARPTRQIGTYSDAPNAVSKPAERELVVIGETRRITCQK